MEAQLPSAFTPEMQEIAALAKSLGHPARVAIVRQLLRRPGCTGGELVAALPLSQSTVSQHLRALSAVGLVANEATGARACYQLVPTRWQQARQLLMGLTSLPERLPQARL